MTDIDKPDSTNSHVALRLQSLLNENKKLQDIISKNSTNNQIKSDALAKQKINYKATLDILFSEYCIFYEFSIEAINSPYNSKEEKDAQKKLTKEEFERVLKEEYDPEKNEFKKNELNLALNTMLIRHPEFINQFHKNNNSQNPPNFFSNEVLKISEFISSSINDVLKLDKPSNAIKSTPLIPSINQVQSVFSVTLDSIVKSFSKTENGNGLFENINGNPIPLASEGHPFQVPQQWLTGSESLQSWFSSTTTFLFTSIPKSVKQDQEPNKQEPNSDDDHNLKQKIRESVIKNLAQRRSTPPPNQKPPPSPEKARSGAIHASEMAIKASMRARSSDYPVPTKRPQSPESNLISPNLVSQRTNLKRKREEEPEKKLPLNPSSLVRKRIAYFGRSEDLMGHAKNTIDDHKFNPVLSKTQRKLLREIRKKEREEAESRRSRRGGSSGRNAGR
jgi:hypothetical protein